MKKTVQIVFIVCFVLALVSVLGLTLKNSDKTVSEVENRTLAKAPEYTSETLLSGEYFADWEDFLIDHAAARNTVVKANTYAEMNILRLPVVNGIYISDEFLLAVEPEKYGKYRDVPQRAEKAAADIASLSDYADSQGAEYIYVGIPTQMYYYRNETPAFCDKNVADADEISREFFSALAEKNVRFVDVDSSYEALGRPQDFYTVTDHHYSFKGAFAAYTAVMEKINAVTGLNVQVLTMEDISPLTFVNPFMGSRNRELFGLYATDEKLTVGALKQGIAYSRWDDGVQTDAPILGVPVNTTEQATYSVFMGGDFGETIVRTNRPELPKILVYGDSFSNALESLIYASFDEMRTLDLRYYNDMSLREYIADYKPDVVICVRDCGSYLDGTGNGQT